MEKERTRTGRKGRGNYFRSVTLGVISVKLFVESYWITRLGAPVLCTAARGILREIRLIRLILLGRFHSGAMRRGAALRLPAATTPFTRLPHLDGVPRRTKPGAVVLYLKDSQRQRCAEATFSSGNLISSVESGPRPLFTPPREISTALRFLAHTRPTRIPGIECAIYAVSTQVNQKGRPSRKASPKGGTVSSSPAFIRRQCTMPVCLRSPSTPPPSSRALLPSRSRLRLGFDLWRIIFTLISSRQMSPGRKTGGECKEERRTGRGINSLERLYPSRRKAERDCGNEWGKYARFILCEIQTNDYSRMVERNCHRRLNRIRANRVIVLRVRVHCELSIIHDGPDLSRIFNFIAHSCYYL